MPLLHITNKTRKKLPINDLIGSLQAGQYRVIELTLNELEISRNQLVGLSRAGLIGWYTSPNNIEDDDDAEAVSLGTVLPNLVGTRFSVLMENPGFVPIFRQLTQDMILPGFGVTSYAKTGPDGSNTLYRRGDELTGLGVSAAYVSGPPTSVTVTNVLGGSTSGSDIAPGLWSIPDPYTVGSMAGSVKRLGSDLGSDPYMTVTLDAVLDIFGDSSAFTITWTRDVYYGLGAAGITSEGTLKAMSSSLATGRGRTIVVSPSNQKVYYSYPKAYGLASFTLNGFPAAFSAPTEVSFTNTNGVLSTYYVYESVNLLTGSNLAFSVS